jgi:hypothetical protein
MVQSIAEAPTLEFTAHSQVRYIERFLDKEVVQEARRHAKNDVDVLALLATEFADDLRHFRHIVQVAYFHLLQKAGRFVNGTSYRIKLGSLSVCIEGNTCKTTICKRYDGARPDPTDDDPMEEPATRIYDFDEAA